MSRLIYIANMRLPTEKAHGNQIMQMCEAFAEIGHDVTLVVPNRVNTPMLRRVKDPWHYYAVDRNFRIVRLPCLDLIWLFSQSQASFLMQTSTYFIALMLWLITQRFDVLFSRDQLVMAGLAFRYPGHKLIYEVHHKARSKRAQRIEGFILRRVGRIVSLTQVMADQLGKTHHISANRFIIAHDGVNPKRFNPNITQSLTQKTLNQQRIWDKLGNKFVICYAGRLHTMGMSKGLDVAIEACAMSQVPEICLLLAGGPEDQVEALRHLWSHFDLPADQFLAVGSIPPGEVPGYLALADVCIIASPANEFFSNETSPMKLFEYMMAGRAILASDLPSTREVVQHGESAYLVTPSDVDAFASGLRDLYEQPDLRQRLGENARLQAQTYTWRARAVKILPIDAA